MVKVKINATMCVNDDQYVGYICEAFKFVHSDGNAEYCIYVDPTRGVMWLPASYCEEVEDDKPTLAAAHEPDLRTIKMSDIIKDLGIDVGDIVCVNVKGTKHYLECTKEYELVNLLACYEDSVPHLILGMINCKYAYAVYSYNMGFAVAHVDNDEE